MASKNPIKKVKVKGLLINGAFHSGGRIKYGEVVEVSARDAKILLSRKQVVKVK